MVDKVLYGDTLPHLFVYHWLTGQTSCYNYCGFIQTSSKVTPGQAVTIGSSGNYSISYSSSKWYISYNGTAFGYFPETIWSGAFTQAGLVQAFGEVEILSNSPTQCIQMGNGQPGNSSSAAKISNFSLIGTGSAPSLSPYQTAPSTYSYGLATPTSLSIGGPGAC